MSEKERLRPGREGKSHEPDMHAREESDWLIVPEKAANEAQAEESPEGRGRTKENTIESDVGSTQSEQTAIPGLERVRRKAKEDKHVRFNALLHHLTVERLMTSYMNLKMEAATGVDGQSWKQYHENLWERLVDLHGRVHRGAYRAQPCRRVYLEKPDGRKRPIGIAALEDKIVQGAVVEILSAIYEEDIWVSAGMRSARRIGCVERGPAVRESGVGAGCGHSKFLRYDEP